MQGASSLYQRHAGGNRDEEGQSGGQHLGKTCPREEEQREMVDDSVPGGWDRQPELQDLGASVPSHGQSGGFVEEGTWSRALSTVG